MNTCTPFRRCLKAQLPLALLLIVSASLWGPGAGSRAFGQPGPLLTLRNTTLTVSAAVLTSNGVPGLSATPAQLMVSAVQTNSSQGGRVSLNVSMWAKSYNGPGNWWDLPAKMVVDGSGNVIVTGHSYGAGTSDDFTTIKYTSAGTPLWTNRYDGASHGTDNSRFVAVDNLGNVYITGDSANASGSDITTIKYAADGAPLWTNHFALATAQNWQPAAFAVSPSGAVYMAPFAFDMQYPAYIVVKFDTSGNGVWTNYYKGTPTGFDNLGALGVDAAGNLFVTGGVQDGVASLNYATLKYAPDGTCLWTNRYVRDGWESASSLAVDMAGNVIVTGDSDSSVPSHAYMTVKYSKDGIPLWTNGVAGPNYMGGGVPLVVVDPAGNVLVTGGSPAANGDYADFTTVKYSPAGIPLWTNQFYAVSTYGEFIGGTAVDSAGNFYLCGNCSRTYGLDYFTVKYLPEGRPVWTNYYTGYTGSGTVDDQPECMAVGANGSVYVSGFVTLGTSSAVNWQTIAYSNIVRYIPPANFVGTDSFTFVAYDTLGNSATGTVTVAVLPLSLQFNTSPDVFRWTPVGLQMQVDGARTMNPVVILASTNLASWNPVFTNVPYLGSVQFTDPTANSLLRRYYRAVQ